MIRQKYLERMIIQIVILKEVIEVKRKTQIIRHKILRISIKNMA